MIIIVSPHPKDILKKMLLIPAIDLKQGKCVRLLQGQEEEQTIYSDDPVSQALEFQKAGAQRLHLVDLDGAFRGRGENHETIGKIISALNIPVQVGGGIRTPEDVETKLKLGAASVIIGTMAVKNPEHFEQTLETHGGDSVFLGIDARNRRVAVEGWKEGTDLEDVEFAKLWKSKGVKRVIFTDIARDGMLSGPNLEALEDFTTRSGLNVTASGGVSSIEDLKNLRRLETSGVDQVIVGKAIYDGRINLKEALEC